MKGLTSTQFCELFYQASNDMNESLGRMISEGAAEVYKEERRVRAVTVTIDSDKIHREGKRRAEG